jgi:hypothetical protein
MSIYNKIIIGVLVWVLVCIRLSIMTYQKQVPKSKKSTLGFLLFIIWVPMTFAKEIIKILIKPSNYTL